MPVSDYTPSLADVAAQLPTRTVTEWGGEAGTFNSDTRPTSTQVQSLIDRAVGRVATRIGADLPNANLIAMAKEVIALRVALRIELDNFPEQVRSGQSPYDQLKRLYDEEYQDLLDAVTVARAAAAANYPDDGMAPGGGFASGTFTRERLIGPGTEL